MSLEEDYAGDSDDDEYGNEYGEQDGMYEKYRMATGGYDQMLMQEQYAKMKAMAKRP